MKILLWFECLILFTVFILYTIITEKLALIQNSADWYTQRGLHPWEAAKARRIYSEEANEKMKETLKDLGGK